MSKKFCAAILFGILITCAATGLSYAAVITPDLQQAMQFADPAGDVSVIINLADRVDLNAMTVVLPNQRAGNFKVHKRDAIVKALRDKAKLTQGFLKTLLQKRGGMGVKSLWITNSIADPALTAGDTLETMGTLFYSEPGNAVNITFPGALSLSGGWDPSYNTNPYMTNLQGSMTVTSGTVTVDKLIIQ